MLMPRPPTPQRRANESERDYQDRRRAELEALPVPPPPEDDE